MIPEIRSIKSKYFVRELKKNATIMAILYIIFIILTRSWIFIIIGIIGNVLWFLPVLLLIFNHFKHKDKMVYSIGKEFITVKKNKAQFTYHKKELKKIVRYRATTRDLNRADFPWEAIHFYRIIFNDDKVYFISSLYMDNIPYDQIEVKRKVRFFPFIMKKDYDPIT